MTIIEIKNLKKYFGKTKAVDGISFNVEKGEVFGFLGPNGAGKTTTIRMLLGFVKSNSGEISLFPQIVSSFVDVKRRIGYLPADVRLYDNWTGHDHIVFLEKLQNKKSIALELVKRFDFNPKIKFRNLSSGNKRKLGLILALMFKPELVILDEPTAGLDPLLQNTVYEILSEFQENGSTIFFSSHNLTEVEKICHRVAIIKNGKLVAIENIQSLKNKRIHQVLVRPSNKISKNELQIKGVEIQEELSDGYILSVKGDINPLIKKLSQFDLKDLEISHASLEEVFLEFYH